MSVKKQDLEALTTFQLKNIVKAVVNKLGLKVVGQSKEDLVNTLFNLHKGNKFFGKKLLSLDDSGHIKLPERQNRKNVKALKEARKRAKVASADVKAKDEKIKKLDRLQKDFAIASNPKESLQDIMKKFQELNKY
tara:strand:- start:176 stop:580 length:405 start_codon:yes stop_codon:yes gene_type:complete